ncbi:hypothetical protein CTA2_9988 [Colletotrichum tanaceti]|nr:hypothetical protein CTA2_9988 [Colletotrichum tanaceti]
MPFLLNSAALYSAPVDPAKESGSTPRLWKPSSSRRSFSALCTASFDSAAPRLRWRMKYQRPKAIRAQPTPTPPAYTAVLAVGLSSLNFSLTDLLGSARRASLTVELPLARPSQYGVLHGMSWLLNEADLLGNLDALPRARLIPERVLLSRAVVCHLRRFDVHGVRTGSIVGLSSGPFLGPLGHAGVAARPDTEAEAHGRLGVGLGVVGILREKSPYVVSIDPPLELLFGPNARVVVEFVMDASRYRVLVAVVPILNTLAEEVAQGIVLDAKKLPVDLVQRVAEPHHRAHDALAFGRPQVDFRAAPKEIKLGPNRRRVALLADGKLGTVLGGVLYRSNSRLPGVARWCRVEVEVVVHAESRVGRASRVHRVAFG